MLEIDWEKLLIPSGSLAEIVIRGTLTYLTLFVTMRLLPRREIGGLAASDILILVLIADAVQQGMAGTYESVTEGLLLVAVIIGWATLIDVVDERFPHLHLAEKAPLPVVKNGRILHRNLGKENMTEDELMSELRRNGVASASEVKLAYIEGSGQVSVLKKGGGSRPPPAEPKA